MKGLFQCPRNYVGDDGPSILADKNIPISLYWYKK